MGYDIIGDIHGHATTLEALLVELGYAPVDGIWCHPERQVIFLGDFIETSGEPSAVCPRQSTRDMSR